MIKSSGLTLPNGSLLRFNYHAPETKRKSKRNIWLVGRLFINKGGNRIFCCEQNCSFMGRNKNYWGIVDWEPYVYMTTEEYVLWKMENA